jgi:hypothetical protein
MKDTTHIFCSLDYLINGKSMMEEAFRHHKLKRRVLARYKIKGYPNYRFIKFLVFGDDQLEVLDRCYREALKNAPQEVMKSDLTLQRVWKEFEDMVVVE